MPLPEPEDDENEEEFMFRCYNSEIMEEEFPDDDQRRAVCLRQWNEEGGDVMDKVPFDATKEFSFEVKELDEEKRVFEGYASIFGNVDAYGDIVQQGAFKKTLQERAEKIKILWQHDTRQPIGKLIDAEEDQVGLKIKGKISETEKGNEALKLMKDGVISELSIGYDTIKKEFDEDGNRLLKEIKLYEVSPVTFAANEMALVTGVKEATSFDDLPLADREREWNADAAESNLREYAGGPDKEDINWDDYQDGFLYYDEDNPENFTSYKFPFADVIDGELYAIPRGIFTAAAVLQGAMVEDAQELEVEREAIEGMKGHIASYYGKMRSEWDDFDQLAPWNEEESSKDLYSLLAKQAKDNDNYQLEVKEEVKEGRTLSEANYERVQNALQLLQEVLEDTETPSGTQSSTEPNEAGKGTESGNHSEIDKKLDEILEVANEL